MSHGLTHEQAAAILSGHVSKVPKQVTKGELTSTGEPMSRSAGRKPRVWLTAEPKSVRP